MHLNIIIIIFKFSHVSSFPPPHHPCSLKTLYRDRFLAVLLTGRREEEQNNRGDVCPQSLSIHFVSCPYVFMCYMCIHAYCSIWLCEARHFREDRALLAQFLPWLLCTLCPLFRLHLLSHLVSWLCLLLASLVEIQLTGFGSGPSLHSSKQTSFLLHKQL